MVRCIHACLYLFLKRDLERDGSVAAQEVEIDGLFEERGIGRNVLVLELDLALAALVVFGTNIVVEDVEGQDHVVQGVDVKGEGLVPDRISVARFGRGDLCTVVLVADLENMKMKMDQTKE